jgi:hypothetical protein
MKTWRDISRIKVPLYMKSLPRDDRGYPIPYGVTVGTDGKPDFRVIDEAKLVLCIKERRCAICGKVMNGPMAFVGGPRSIQGHLFTDGPMHPPCAHYAIQVCPFLAAPKFAYARHINAPAGHVTKTNELVSDNRPDVFGIGVTAGFQVVLIGEDDFALQAGAWLRPVDWYRNGENVNEEINPQTGVTL